MAQNWWKSYNGLKLYEGGIWQNWKKGKKTIWEIQKRKEKMLLIFKEIFLKFGYNTVWQKYSDF